MVTREIFINAVCAFLKMEGKEYRNLGIVFYRIEEELYEGILYDVDSMKNSCVKILSEEGSFDGYIRFEEESTRSIDSIMEDLESIFDITRNRYSLGKSAIPFKSSLDQMISIVSNLGFQVDETLDFEEMYEIHGEDWRHKRN